MNMLNVVAAIAALLQSPAVVTIARSTPGHWRATYAFAVPVTGFRFERPASFFREQCWTVVTPGYRLARDGDAQVVRLDSGATASTALAFDLAECTQALSKEYEQFLPFTDGAVAIYTGHFYGRPVGAPDMPSVRTLRIVPPAGMHAIAIGRVARGPLTWTDTLGEGTYVYLGRARPIETPNVVAVIDPGMPAWLRARLDRAIPRLFDRYASLLGARLPWKPLVLYSFHDTMMSGANSGGGTLPRFLSMTLEGHEWTVESPARAEQAVSLMAHESAHLWNGQLVQSDSADAGAWIHEGSADAMANEQLLALGIIDSARARARREEALNLCASAERTVPVDSAIGRHAVREVYDCGWAMAMWTGALRGDVAGGMFAFWRDFLRATQAAGGRYDQSLYFATLRNGGVADSTILAMQRFLRSRDSIGIVVRGLRTTGVGVREVKDPPITFQQHLARDAMVHLMSVACRRVSFNTGDPIRTSAVAGCAPFAQPMVVSRIAGFRVGDQGAALYDAVVAECAAQRAVVLADSTGRELTSVPCARAPVTRLPWYPLE